MRTTVIIPAYNEENSIQGVLQPLVNINLLTEIIVVDDGSNDNTAQIASSFGVKVICLDKNIGKGGAMMRGVQVSSFSNLLFLDADLIGLKEEHVASLLFPVIEDKYMMSIGIFEDGRLPTDLAQLLAPFLSGQRAVKKELFNKIYDLDTTRFGVEVALTKYAKEKNIPVKEVFLKDLTHVMKEEKLGIVKGLAARAKMYYEIAKLVSKNKENETEDNVEVKHLD